MKQEYEEITNEKFYEISRSLEHHHALFYKLWEMGKPQFDPSVETAAVAFDREKGEFFAFLFAPEFWYTLDDYERSFIISHEALHIILNHGYRTLNTINKEMCNVALDVVVNHTLVNNFGFDRSRLCNTGKGCWVDTVWPNENVPENKSFEFYYGKLIKEAMESGRVKKIGGGGGSGEESGDGLPSTFDDHSGLHEAGKHLEDIFDELNESLSAEDKKTLSDFFDKHFQNDDSNSILGRSATGEGSWFFMPKPKVKEKKKWETVIKKWSLKYRKSDDDCIEQWARMNRRHSMLPRDMFLPSEMDDESKKEDMIEVYFFQDTSGSCKSYAPRFFKAAHSLPKKRFKVRAFCFDTRVVEINLSEGKIYGGGGTSFDIIESRIQSIMKKENTEYPKAVFMITDGYGNDVRPQLPQNWYIFLTNDSQRSRLNFPKNCNFFNLRDFE